VKSFVLLSTAATIAPIFGCMQPNPEAPSSPVAVSAPAATSPEPLAAFARFIGGHWKMTTTAGRNTYDTWVWGPGKQSIRSMRSGTLTEGDPWRVITVYYWHPTFKEVRLHSVGSVWRGVGEGRIRFEGDTAESVFALHQFGVPPDLPRGPRNLREKWNFVAPDTYRDDLFEKVRGEYELLTGWDRVRVEAVPPAERVAAPLLAFARVPSHLMRPLEKVLGQAWSSIAAPGGDVPRTEGQPRTRTTFEYVPHADVIMGRIDTIGADGASSHAMDVYLYHHTGTGTLRVLALGSGIADDGPVYEGDIVPSADRTSLTVTLTEHLSTGPRTLEALVAFEKDGTARVRVWGLSGQERTMLMDLRHSRERE
jgi:hypothetical protein